MLLLVFPFSPQPEPAPSAVRAEMIENFDGTPFAPSPMPELTESRPSSEVTEARLEPQHFQSLSELQIKQKPELTILGIGAGGGNFSNYGLTAGSGSGPKFFGLGGSERGVRNIVYVVDRSGSMLDTFEYVRRELKRSVSTLRRTQKFHVIFFSGGMLENPPKGLVSAIQEQKNHLFKFLDSIQPQGSTHPEQAMRRALGLRPDLIYFLTDGEFDSSLVAKLQQWNKDHNTRIYTIAYFDRSGAQLLEEIAREHGGEFKYVTENDIP